MSTTLQVGSSVKNFRHHLRPKGTIVSTATKHETTQVSYPAYQQLSRLITVLIEVLRPQLFDPLDEAVRTIDIEERIRRFGWLWWTVRIAERNVTVRWLYRDGGRSSFMVATNGRFVHVSVHDYAFDGYEMLTYTDYFEPSYEMLLDAYQALWQLANRITPRRNGNIVATLTRHFAADMDAVSYQQLLNLQY